MSDELARLKVWWAGLNPDAGYCAGNDEFAKDVISLMQRCEKAEQRIAGLEERLREYKNEWESCCERERARWEAEKELRQRIVELERERDEARDVLREFLASGVEHDEPRMDYITMQIDRATLAAARAAGEGEK
jgi:chromosome segregation ATPase